MTAPAAPVTLRDPNPPHRPEPDPEAYAIEATLRALIALGADTTPRHRQGHVGLSGVGSPCQRQHAYRLAGTPPVNIRDPLRTLVGTGVHSALAELFTRLDHGTGRYLVETPVSYRGVPGTVDLYDRANGCVVDFKTTFRNRLSKLRADGPSLQQIVQIQGYGAGLTAVGEHVRTVALAFIPIDTTLDDLWVWRTPYSPALVDVAIDRLNETETIRSAAKVPATPSALCPWCDHYQPDATYLGIACPGTTRKDSS